MSLRREMLNLKRDVEKQRCKIKRWKLTRTQAKILAPTLDYYWEMVAGHTRYFGVPVYVKNP